MKIRPGTAGDAKVIIDVHYAAVHQTAATSYPVEVLDSWSRRPDEARYQQIRGAVAKSEELFVVADDSSGVIGFGSIVPNSSELCAVYVHPKLGRRGIGSRILAELERLAVDRGMSQLGWTRRSTPKRSTGARDTSSWTMACIDSTAVMRWRASR